MMGNTRAFLSQLAENLGDAKMERMERIEDSKKEKDTYIYIYLDR